jgi:hypothetical protein
VEERLELVEKRLDGMDKRFDRLEGKVDSNHLLAMRKFQRLDERFSSVEDRLDESDRRIDGRFDVIKEWSDGVGLTLQSIVEKLNEIGSRMGPVV